MAMTTPQLIKSMSNKDLIHTINKIRHEKKHPETYGKYGTTRWVTSSEFWTGHHQDLKNELKRRQKAGLVKKQAGVPRKQALKSSIKGLYSFNDLMKM